MTADQPANPMDRRYRVAALLIIKIVVLAGIVYSVFLGDRVFYPDEPEYVTLARNMAFSGMYSYDGMTPTAFRPPGFAAVLAPIAAVGGKLVHLRVLNFLLLGACFFLLHRIATRVSSLAGLVAVVLAAGYPLLFYTASCLFPQTLVSALLLATVTLLFEKRSLARSSALGLCLGTLWLTVPASIPVLAIAFLWQLVARPRTGAVHLWASVACFVVLAAGWSARNCVTMGHMVPVSTNGGINLLLGNSENTTPSGGSTIDVRQYILDSDHMGEVEQDRYFAVKARDYVSDNPGAALRMYGLKLLNYFNYRNTLRITEESTSWRDLLMLVTYGGLLVGCLIRLFFVRRFPLDPLEVFALVLYLANGAFAAVFFTRIRFRVPYDYLLIIVLAGFLSQVIQRRLSRNSS